MRRRKDFALEQALRRSRVEPGPDFLRTLVDEIRGDVQGPHRRRSGWLGLALAVALTAVIVSALGAVGAAGAAGSATKAVVHVVKLAVAPKQTKVHVVKNTPAQDQYRLKCNSGRGNLSETNTGTHQTNSSTLINPHTGGTGPGNHPTGDCDPGNSGPHNSGGD